MEQGTEQGGNGRKDLEVIQFNNPMSHQLPILSFCPILSLSKCLLITPNLPVTVLGSRERNAYRELDPDVKARSKQIIMEIKLPTGIHSMKEKIRTVIDVQKGLVLLWALKKASLRI